ncbi:MAG: type II toxin-antitoxin system death-on-curing family toxin [Acidobacteriota bacterium]
MIDVIRYLTYVEAVVEHFELMRRLGEIPYGVFEHSLIKSALARPQQAAAYGDASLAAQAATLCFGLIKNHPWVGGNKRTATHLTDRFLKINGMEIICTTAEILEMVLAVESDQWTVSQLEEWMSQYIKSVKASPEK